MFTREKRSAEEIYRFSNKSRGYIQSAFENGYEKDVLSFLSEIYIPLVERYLSLDPDLRTHDDFPEDIDYWETRLEGFEGDFDYTPLEVPDLYRGFYEEVYNLWDDTDFDKVIGIATSGLPFAAIVANLTNTPFEMVKYSHWDGNDERVVDRWIGDSLQGKKVVLVDDTISTGETVENVTNYLNNQGVSSIHGAFLKANSRCASRIEENYEELLIIRKTGIEPLIRQNLEEDIKKLQYLNPEVSHQEERLKSRKPKTDLPLPLM